MADLGYYVCTVIKTVWIFSLSTLTLYVKYNTWRCTGTKIQAMKMDWYKNTIYEDVLVLKYNPWRCTDTKKSIHEDVLVQKQYCCFPLAYKFFEVVGKYVNYSFCFK